MHHNIELCVSQQHVCTEFTAGPVVGFVGDRNAYGNQKSTQNPVQLAQQDNWTTRCTCIVANKQCVLCAYSVTVKQEYISLASNFRDLSRITK